MMGHFSARLPIWAVFVILALTGLILTGCAAQSAPTPLPTLAPLPTYTPYPTYTPAPTYTPLPTYTPMPTVVPPTNTPTPTPTPTPFVYTVKPGDWASLIAKRFSVTLESLLTVNNIQNPNLVEPGQQLIIPISGTGTLTATSLLTATLPSTRTVVWRPTATPWPYPSEAASADLSKCESRALLIIHTFWSDKPEPGVKFDIHSQPANPNHDPAKFRFATNEKGTAYFCMPEHTRYYFFTDREATFDARLEPGEVVEKVINVPRLDLALVSPLGNTFKPETPIPFSWQSYPGAVSYVLTIYGEQENFWGGEPQVVAFQAQVKAPQTQATASLSFDAAKGIFPGQVIRWMVTAYNARGTVIGKSRPSDFTMLP